MQLQSLFERTPNKVAQVKLSCFVWQFEPHWENIANLKHAVPVGSRRTRRIFTSDIQQKQTGKTVGRKRKEIFLCEGKFSEQPKKNKMASVSNKVTLKQVKLLFGPLVI